MVAMAGLGGIAIVLLVADAVIRFLFKNKSTANVIGLVIALLATVLLLGMK